jgi:superfamily II DNA or RNA helicase
MFNKKGNTMTKVAKPVIQLHPHQQDAYDKVVAAIKLGKGSAKGRIVIPTGGGKTFVQAACLDYQRVNNRKTRIHLVLAPRIMLANQLIEDYRVFSGPAYRVVAFHSGTHEPDYEKDQVKWAEKATIRYEAVAEEYTKALNKNQDLVVFSTYHSCKKLNLIEFDTIIADESQYAVGEGFHEAVKSLNGRVKLFFTATEKFTASVNGRGLNNESVYGKRLFEISPSELIKLGLIVPPRLHVMYGQANNAEDTVIDTVIQLGQEQDKLTRAEMPFSKILYAMKTTDDVKTVIDNLPKLKVAFPDHHIYTIISNANYGPMIDGVKESRKKFMDNLRNGEHDNVLIFHYDILSEGIDIAGITGVALMREMSVTKLIQTIGRAVRTYKDDPSKKTQAWISVPVINGNQDAKDNVRKIVQTIRNGGFDISSETVVETGVMKGISDGDQLDDAFGTATNNYSNLFIESVFHDIEDAEFWEDIQSMSFEDALKELI